MITKWCLEDSDLLPQDTPVNILDLRSAEEDEADDQIAETDRSTGDTEEPDTIVVQPGDVAGAANPVQTLTDGSIFKRNVHVRPRKPKYQTNFL